MSHEMNEPLLSPGAFLFVVKLCTWKEKRQCLQKATALRTRPQTPSAAGPSSEHRPLGALAQWPALTSSAAALPPPRPAFSLNGLFWKLFFPFVIVLL